MPRAIRPRPKGSCARGTTVRNMGACPDSRQQQLRHAGCCRSVPLTPSGRPRKIRGTRRFGCWFPEAAKMREFPIRAGDVLIVFSKEPSIHFRV
jgi:hypothetical protein